MGEECTCVHSERGPCSIRRDATAQACVPTGAREVGLVPTAAQIGYALGILFLAPLGDRYDRRSIILVKADYRWPLMSPFVATAFSRSGPLEVTISARTAFKNEPFE